MKNAVKQPANTMDYTNTSGSTIPSGSLVAVLSGAGGLCGVAVADIPNNATGPVVVKDIEISVPADFGTGKTFAQGDKLYFNGTKVLKASTGNTPCGRSALAKSATAQSAPVTLGM